MKRLSVMLLAVVLCFALPVMAQHDHGEMEHGEHEAMSDFAQPKPLDNEFLSWLEGEWQGKSMSAMGESKDWMVSTIGLDGQFLMTEYKSESPMGKYKGMGAMTLAEDGGVRGFWIDNWRTMGTGKGTIEGNKMTVTWESSMGTGTRVTEKVSDDKFVVNEVWTLPNGAEMESTSEMTRVKKSDMTKKGEMKKDEMMQKGEKMKDEMTEKKN